MVIGDLLEAEGRALAAERGPTGGEVVYVPLDVTRESDWDGAMAAAAARFGRLDILVNNAGIGGAGRLEDTRLEDWNRVMAVNATGVFLGTKAAIPALRQAGGGSIVNISSQLGLVGMDDSSPQYQASKGAVRLLTKLTALQYAQGAHPRQLGASQPHRDPDDGSAPRRPHRLRAHDFAHTPRPLRRGGGGRLRRAIPAPPDESRFVTGSELVIDGGWTAQ